MEGIILGIVSRKRTLSAMKRDKKAKKAKVEERCTPPRRKKAKISTHGRHPPRPAARWKRDREYTYSSSSGTSGSEMMLSSRSDKNDAGRAASTTDAANAGPTSRATAGTPGTSAHTPST